MGDVHRECAADFFWAWVRLRLRALRRQHDEMERIRLTALLHDIGKGLIAREIILKPGELTAEEREQVKAHPVASARIAASIHGLGDIVDGVRCHHERFDGSGYPEGRSGDTIPLAARVTAVADAYDMMMTDQPYRQAMTQEQCVAELRTGAGKQFDPAVVEACIQLLQEGSLEASGPITTLETLLG